MRSSAHSISETDAHIYTHMPSASHMVVVHMCTTYLHTRLIRSHSIPAPHMLTTGKEMLSMNIIIFHLKYIPDNEKICERNFCNVLQNQKQFKFCNFVQNTKFAKWNFRTSWNASTGNITRFINARVQNGTAISLILSVY